jgi:hypothetical protein
MGAKKLAEDAHWVHNECTLPVETDEPAAPAQGYWSGGGLAACGRYWA